MASSSSNVGEGNEKWIKPDPKSPLWKYVTVINKISGGGGYTWVCHECHKQYKGSYTRVRGHLCHKLGTGCAVCLGPDVDGRPGRGLSVTTIAKYQREQDDADALVEAAKQKSTPYRGLGQGSSQRPPLHPQTGSSIGQKRSNLGPLEKAFNLQSREDTDQMIARCLYATGIAFNVVRSPYWQEMVRSINEAPKGYKGPGYEKIRTTLLIKERDNIDRSLEMIRASWRISGVSIICDGWKDVRNRPLINVIAMSPKGAMFLKAVECKEEKDTQFIANILIEAIESVGPENVVQVITDNAKVCRAAGLVVEARYSHIWWTPCAVHSLNLMLQNIGKIEWIQKIYEEAKEIQMFICNHHMPQAIYRQFAKLELLKVVETRFGTHYIVLKRLVDVKQALKSMVISDIWTVWRQSQTERANNMRNIILDDDWWAQVEYLLAFTGPIYALIRRCDTDQPILGDIYDCIDTMVEQIRDIIMAKERDPSETFYKQIYEIVKKRWDKMTTPLQLLAYALNPKYYHS